MSTRVQNRVGELRRARALTQEDLARALGVSRQTIIALERGNYAPSIVLALRIAVYFKKPVDTIFYLT